VSEADGPRQVVAGPSAMLQFRGDATHAGEEIDFKDVAYWAFRRHVLLAGLLLIAVQLAWKWQFLSHMYFRQDDFYNLDLAIKSPLSWHFLTFNTAGNIVIGTQLITWILARVSLYDWGLASAVVLVLVAAASLAALRLMRTLFGDRPAILIPLSVYVLIPLTLPGLGWWSAALESVPLQLAIFMALNAHVWYVRTRRARHLVAAAAWVVFGLAFFEKALVLPLLLFLVTAAYIGGGSWLAGARLALARFWRAWLVYAILVAVGAVLLVASLRTSTIHPHAPASARSVLTFVWGLVHETVVPGMLGGPWRWLPVDGAYALASPPAQLAWAALIAVVLIIGASIVRRKTAWRSWAILAVWLIVADMLPVIIGRLNYLPAVTFGMETRYVADAAPVIAICLGLAFLPLAQRGNEATTPARHHRQSFADAVWKPATALLGIFVLGSIWSAISYERHSSGHFAAAYIANARRAIAAAPRGSVVLDWPVPAVVVSGLFGRYDEASTVIGDMERGKLAGKLRWIKAHPAGTVDGLLIFGTDGRLHQAQLSGVASARRSSKQGCWPERGGGVVVRFATPTSTLAWELRIGYIWGPQGMGHITVQYGHSIRQLEVRHGLHSAYMPVSGTAKSIKISGLGSSRICVGDVQAGALVPDPFGPTLPATP
jgi:hypothetical protein